MDLLGLDRKLFFLINHSTSNFVFDTAMPFLTASGYVLIFPYLLYLCWKGYKDGKNSRDFTVQAALWAIGIAFLSSLVADWLGNEMKHIIMRERPCNTLDGVRLLVGCTRSFSMPSNHAATSFGFALPLFYFARRYVSIFLRSYPFILASLIAFSRVYLGVHYPTDVAVGAFLGIAVSAINIFFFEIATQEYKTRPYTTILVAGLVVVSVFRIYYILNGPLDLSPDEAHYWEWSRRPDLSYYSKGPMIACLIYLGTAIFGHTVFGIRIMAVLFSALSSICLFNLVNVMYKENRDARPDGDMLGENLKCKAALFSALLIQIIPLFSAFGILFTIDSPFIFFWIMSLFFFWKATSLQMKSIGQGVDSRDRRRRSFGEVHWWLLAGIFIGFGLLTKYTMAFFYLCALLFLLSSEKRRLLMTPQPYVALLLSFIVFSPVIIWNIGHDWVAVRHTAGQAHIGEGFTISPRSFFEFLGSQIGVITPILFCVMICTLFRPHERFFKLQNKFVFWFSIPILGFFLLKSLQGKVQANWAMPGYITGIMAMSHYFGERRPNARFPRTLRLKEIAIWSGLGMALFISIVGHYPSLVKLPPNLDPSARLRGWKQLGTEASRINATLEKGGPVFIFSDAYQVASELAFYVEGQPKTYCINIGRRMNQYDFWPDMNSDAQKVKKRKEGDASSTINGIFVRIGDVDMPSLIAESFDRHEKRIVKVYERKRFLKEYSVFICYNFKGIKTSMPGTY